MAVHDMREQDRSGGSPGRMPALQITDVILAGQGLAVFLN